MENRILLFFTGCFTLLLSSCLDSDDKIDYDLAKNCQISSFSLKHDSIPGLNTTKFTIDQIEGRIFNQDSLPYGTKVDKVVATVTYQSPISIGSVQVMQEAAKDSTIYWNGTDSLDYSKPVRFIITAYDGLTKKIYETKLNIHQVVPDSMVWALQPSPLPGTDVVERKTISFTTENVEQYYMYTTEASGNHLYTSSLDLTSWSMHQLSGLPENAVRWEFLTEYEGKLYVPSTDRKLYRSADGLVWEWVSNAPSTVAILGIVKEEPKSGQPSALSIIADKSGVSHFACMDKTGVWSEGKAISADFPISGFASLPHNVMFRERLLIAGGKTADNHVLSSIWSTMDGLTWTTINPDAKFAPREGAAIAQYDSTFFLLGGFDKNGKALKDIYRSKNNGLSWTVSDTLTVMPDSYKARGYFSMIVDKNTNYMYLFGGKDAKEKNDLNELWKGRINRLGFKK